MIRKTTTIHSVLVVGIGLLAIGCGHKKHDTTAASEAAGNVDHALLEEIVSGRSAESRARDKWRHPVETLTFFGAEPDDFVIEFGPGNAGWYTEIIAPYVAERGRYGATAYAVQMTTDFLINPSEERMNGVRTWASRYPVEVSAKYDFSVPPIAFNMDQAPDEILGAVDLILVPREMHNYWRVRTDIDYLTPDLRTFYDLLKPGGVIGITQHRAPEDAEGPTADGTYGYMKTSDVIEFMTNAGFEFEGASEINANPADNAAAREDTEEVKGIVWRLPPTFYYKDNRRDEFAAIGETDRMTLKFRKPKE